LLERVTDRVAMTAMFQSRLQVLAPTTGELTLNNVTLLDSKPGQRALIEYELFAAHGQIHQIFGKVYVDRQQLQRVDHVWQALWNEVFGADETCSVPQPLGIIPELALLLYRPAEGQFLDAVLPGPQAERAMALTAQWLGILHCYPLALTKHFDLGNEVANLAKWAGLVGQHYPEQAPLAQQVLIYLQEQAPHLALATHTPIHKDFHYRHVLVADGLKVIDLDEMRLGDPNFDLAHFCANLHLLAYRLYGTPDALQASEQQFLSAYAHHTGWQWAEHGARFRYFYCYTCLKIARQLCLGFGPSPVPSGAEQQRQVVMILDQGIAMLASQGHEENTLLTPRRKER
jgi:hypothetical protein